MASQTLKEPVAVRFLENDNRLFNPSQPLIVRNTPPLFPGQPMQFEEAVQYLLGLGHETLTIKLGLRTTELLLEALDNPERAFPAVQIAGTNGKGSTAVVFDSICLSAGIKTGLYTSPHLVSMTERVKINGIDISPDSFAQLATQVRNAAQKLVDSEQLEALPTFFEQVTAIALLAFREAKVELAILETGLGGRLDSTTAANAGIVAITQIAFDHEEYLGNTLESIAGEKVAIIRPGVSAIVAAQTPEALAVVLRQSEASNVRPLLDGCSWQVKETTEDGRLCVTFVTAAHKYEQVWLGLRGRHQVGNVALSIQLAEELRSRGLQIPDSAVVAGIEMATHAGRLELIPGSPALLLDGAHNPAGAESLRAFLDEFGQRPLTIIFGAMRDKRLEQMAEILFPAADNLVLTSIENPRAATIDVLEPIAGRFKSQSAIAIASSSSEALGIAKEKTTPDGLICITGSLYLIGELRPLILQSTRTQVAISSTGS
jgi:dihydrofolate synthase/folylpolyglutamate synthase